MTVQRGDIYALDFESQGGSMTKMRPAVVIQNDAANEFAPYTIVAAVHHETNKNLPVFVSVPAGTGNLTKDSVIDLGHILTVPKRVLRKKIGSLPYETMDEVNEAIKVSLGLS